MTQLAGLIELESPEAELEPYMPAAPADDRNLSEFFARLVRPAGSQAGRSRHAGRLAAYGAVQIVEANLEILAADLDVQTVVLRARLKAAVTARHDA